MKILFLVSSMQGGGAERVAALLANAWSSRGHDVTLMPTFSARGNCVYPLSPSVHLDFLSDQGKPTAGRLVRLMMLRRYIRRARPDVIVSFLPHVNVAALLSAMGTGVPVVACERTYPPLLVPPLPASYRLLRRLTYPVAGALVAQTQITARWLRDRARRTKITVIANPILLPMTEVEPAVQPTSLVEASDRLIVWAGRLDSAKRPEIAVEAFANLASRHPNWKLVLLGDGPVRPSLQASLAARGLETRILVPGFVGNLGTWYKRADLYVMTSSYEGFPNSLLEAMAHGTPSVAFDVPTGPAELSAGGRRLRLLPDDDHIERLTLALDDLILRDEERVALASAGAEVLKTYSMDSVLGQWDGLLFSVTKE
jgi:glycosyltransferase involved in cell wall biosynthesis